MQDLMHLEPSRRGVCGALLTMPFARVPPRYQDLGMTVHQILPARLVPTKIGDVIYDRNCGRHLRIVRTMRTEAGLIAKMRWVQRIA